MNKAFVLASAVATTLFAAGCEKADEEKTAETPAAEAPPAVDVAAEEQAIRNRSGEWMNYANAKDVASVVKVYSPDVVTIYDGNVDRGVAEVQASAEGNVKDEPDRLISWSTTAVKV